MTAKRRKRVFLTGATGAMGLAGVRALIAAGHEVVGTTHSRRSAAALDELGATAIDVNIFDEGALREALVGIDVLAHFATSIPLGFAAVRLSAWRTNDRLRREGTATLIAAAEAAGVRRFIFESIALAYPDRGDAWIDESEDLRPPSVVMGTAIEAEAMLAGFAARGGEAVSLRFGRLYGLGRASGDVIDAVRKRWMPIVGSGGNYVSSIHVADAGSAIAAAVDVSPGTYNVVDDEPLTQRVLLETIARSLDAPSPRRMPEMLARVMVGHAAKVLTVSQRVSNRRFREASGWRPRYRSAAHGWPEIAEAAAA